MVKKKIKSTKDLETKLKDILENLDTLKKQAKKQIDRLQNGFTNEQKKGAEITAQKKREQKEWFYQNIWKPYKADGIKGIKAILNQAKKEGLTSVSEQIYTFTMENNNKFSKSLKTLQNWHTEFEKKDNSSL